MWRNFIMVLNTVNGTTSTARFTDIGFADNCVIPTSRGKGG
jgi:hypothetical protein